MTQENADLGIFEAILFLCKLEGQDVKINFSIHHVWTQHTQIDFKNS